MATNGTQLLASSTIRRTSAQRRHLKLELTKRSYLPLSVLSFAPRIIYNPFLILLDYEQRLLKQPLKRIGQLVSQSVQDGLLRSLLHFFAKRPSKVTSRVHGTHRSQRRCRNEAKKNWEKALKLEREMDLEGAIACLERAVTLQPSNLEYLGLLSKQYSDMGFKEGISKTEAKYYNEKALEVAERIVICYPNDPTGHIARGVCKGRLAYYSEPRTKIELAKEAEDAVNASLELNPNCDLGHHLMGRFQYEMAGLNVLCRAFVRIVYGAKLSPGSYHQALQAFERADRIKPDRVIHKVLLGKTYLKLGQHHQAMESLQEAMALDAKDINDHLEQIDGKRLLDNLQRKAVHRPA